MLSGLLALALLSVGQRTVGFEQEVVADGLGPALTVGIWYPSNAAETMQQIGPFQQYAAANGPLVGAGLPLVLISHGSAGSFASHHDTATALARAGFIVAAVTHAGDNYQDQSDAGQVRGLTERPRQMKRVLDFMLAEWPGRARIDHRRVGVFGVSLGGFTALVLAGATPSLEDLRTLCTSQVGAPECQFIKDRHGDQLQRQSGAPDWVHDPRIKSIVVAAPAVGVLFQHTNGSAVAVPIQLWRAERDQVSPNAWNSDVVRRVFSTVTDTHTIAGAGHYVFLPPCPAALTLQVPDICRDPEGIDRVATHEIVNRSIYAFFSRTLH